MSPARKKPADLAERVAENAAVQAEGKGVTVLDLVRRMEHEFEVALPRTLGLEGSEFVRVAITLLRTSPALMECSWPSLAGAMMAAAQLGLSLDPQRGEFYVVPFRNSKTKQREATPIIGYRGIVRLALRSGEVTKVVAREVREGDEFDVEFGDRERVIHRPQWRGGEEERGRIVAVYATAHFRPPTEPVTVVLSAEEVEEYRARSKTPEVGPWVTDWAAMAKKTAVRRLEPWMPSSVEVTTAIAIEDGTVSVPLPLTLPAPAPKPIEVAAPKPETVEPEEAEEPPADGEDGENE